MGSLRIVADNAVERCTIAASTTSGLLAASNLQVDDKSTVWRATGTSATLTGTTTVTEFASCFALLFSNMSPTATIRVRLYSDTAGTTLVLDTNTLQPGALACPWPARVPRGWTAAQAASAYFNGGGAHGIIYFASTGFKKYVVDLVDTNNVQGYIEAARALIGTWWAPANNASAAPLEIIDTTTTYRNGAGGQMADAGTIYDKLSIDLDNMPAADRVTIVGMLTNSRAYPILLDMFPDSTDLALRRDNLIYGRRAADSNVAIQYAVAYGTSLAVEEI